VSGDGDRHRLAAYEPFWSPTCSRPGRCQLGAVSSTVTLRSSAAATACRVVRVAPAPPASRRATAAWARPHATRELPLAEAGCLRGADLTDGHAVEAATLQFVDRDAGHQAPSSAVCPSTRGPGTRHGNTARPPTQRAKVVAWAKADSAREAVAAAAERARTRRRPTRSKRAFSAGGLNVGRQGTGGLRRHAMDAVSAPR
jgi:hypothetical protein